MGKSDNHTLWSDLGRENFFLVPADEDLSIGSLDVITITGDRKKVNSEEIFRFAVSYEEAKQWLRSEFSALIDEAKNQLLTTLVRITNSPPEWSVAAKRNKRAQQDDTNATKVTSPRDKPSDREFHIDQTGKPDSLDALTNILNEFGSLVERAISARKEPRSDKRSQEDELRNLLREYDLDAKGSPTLFFDRLQDWLSMQESSGQLRESASHLENFADKIDSAASISSKRLRSMADAMRKRGTKNGTASE